MGTVFKRKRINKDGKETFYWYLAYAINGKRKWESAGVAGLVTKTMARELLKKREQQVKLGQWDMLEAEIPTLSAFIPKYIEHIRDIKQNRTWRKSEEHLKKLEKVFGSKKLSEINPEDIDEYKAIRVKEVSLTTRKVGTSIKN